MTQNRLPAWPIIVLLFGILWFGTLGSRRLVEPDEGRYAEIPREMLATGDWVTPRLDGLKYFEKPPLQYWATAVAYQTLGQNEFAARLWTGLTGFLGIVLLWFAAGHLFNSRVGYTAAAILASSLLYVVMGHLTTLDMGLSFFLELAVFSFLLAQRSPPKSSTERYWMWVAWAATALGFLSKGLVALILPTFTLLIYTVVTRETSAWKRLYVLSGLPLFLLISVPWIVAVSLQNPEFPRFFFYHEQFERFLTSVHERDAPWWYFLPLIVVGSLPWLSIFLSSFKSSWCADVNNRFQVRRFLWIWIIAVVTFFSMSHSKLAPYITPIFPAIALLTADSLTRMRTRTAQWHLFAMAGILAALAISIALLPNGVAGPDAVDLVADLRPFVASGFAAAACGVVVALWLLMRNHQQAAVIAMGLGTLFGLSLLIYGADALRTTRSAHSLAVQLAPQLKPDTTLYSISQYPQTLPFYLHRTITLVGYRGELDFGLTQEPSLGLDGIDDFLHAWSNAPHPIAILRTDVFEQLKQRGVMMEIVATHHDLLAISKPNKQP
ncbi:MAG: phospholipid carrier-dependent glycosyltransferase [Steroidobacteraceae bacterium]